MEGIGIHYTLDGEGKMQEKAKAERLIDMVGYQKGAIVSKSLMDKETGTVTLFAFDQGQGLSEHTAPFDVMVHVLDGKAEITISGKQNILSQGDMIIMPANQPHSLRAIERFKMFNPSSTVLMGSDSKNALLTGLPS